MSARLLQRLRALSVMAARGTKYERRNAKLLLAKLLKKHGLTEEDLYRNQPRQRPRPRPTPPPRPRPTPPPPPQVHTVDFYEYINENAYLLLLLFPIISIITYVLLELAVWLLW